jgi:hypothetical protein
LTSAAIGDFDRDGQLDLAVSSDQENKVYVLLGNGNGYFGVPMGFSTESWSNPNSVATNDFNNDDRLDLAVANSDEDNVGVMLGYGNGTFQAQMTFSTGVYSNPMAVVIGDFKNDGQLDLAVSNEFTHNVGILLGTGTGTFLAQTTFSTGALSAPYSIASQDFNGDGKLDLIITDNNLNNVGILLNTCDCCIAESMKKSVITYP